MEQETLYLTVQLIDRYLAKVLIVCYSAARVCYCATVQRS